MFHVVPSVLYCLITASAGYVIVTVTFPFVHPVGVAPNVIVPSPCVVIATAVDIVLFPALSATFTLH